MLISISIKNWKSFKDEVTFTMEASREKNHSHTLARFNKFRLNLLPISSIFGPNASGKSNFVKAFSFIQNLVLDPSRGFGSAENYSFRLDFETKKQPTKLVFVLLLNGNIYTYTVIFNRQKLLEEVLSFRNTNTEKILFRRNGGRLILGAELRKEISEESIKFLTPFLEKNYPVLNLLGGAKIGKVVTVYNWFKNSLQIITPDSIPIHRFEKEGSFPEDLSVLGTGICSIKRTKFTGELPEELKRLSAGLPLDSVLSIRDPKYGALRISHEEEGGGIRIEKLLAVHKNDRGEEELFSFTEESDGSLRLFDLKPAFDKLNSSEEALTFVIDEIDRSLHTKLTFYLISRFLEKCNASSRRQLLFTTHDVQLMTQDLLRRDEIWLCDRGIDGSTNLYQIGNQTNLRIDKDIQKSYVLGKLGGLPKI